MSQLREQVQRVYSNIDWGKSGLILVHIGLIVLFRVLHAWLEVQVNNL